MVFEEHKMHVYDKKYVIPITDSCCYLVFKDLKHTFICHFCNLWYLDVKRFAKWGVVYLFMVNCAQVLARKNKNQSQLESVNFNKFIVSGTKVIETQNQLESVESDHYF